ncbi:transposase, partial [Streptomyces narbonensis]|uniref:transposase n=1 Tax=Streptomyces narbonensis TaxID=67333 RepID=UPI00167B63A6
NVKVMLTVFFDSEGVVHHEFLPHGQTVNKEYYIEVMRRLREKIRRKRPAAWEANSWMLHQDNAPAHSSLLVQQFFAKTSTTVMPHPPYSPDLAPADFFLFPKFKTALKGRRFESVESIKENSLKELFSIPKEAYQDCFQKWKKRMHRCIDVGGE